MLSLFWSLVLILFFLYLFSVFFVQGMTEHIIDKGAHITDEELAKYRYYFGNVESAILTLLQATTGGMDWHVAYDFVKLRGWERASVFLFYIVFMVVAVFNIVTSKFVEHAMRLAAPELERILLEQQSKDFADSEKLTDLFRAYDGDSSETISAEEFSRFISNP